MFDHWEALSGDATETGSKVNGKEVFSYPSNHLTQSSLQTSASRSAREKASNPMFQVSLEHTMSYGTDVTDTSGYENYYDRL